MQIILLDKVVNLGNLGDIVKVKDGYARIPDAFLHVSDLDSGVEDAETVERTAATSAVPIESLLREGQEFLVQVLKDPISTKGARLTTRVSIPSRYLVFVPGQTTLGISQRIENDAERERLRGINCGVVGKTAYEHNIADCEHPVAHALLDACDALEERSARLEEALRHYGRHYHSNECVHCVDAVKMLGGGA